jgi:hypothetical protein
VKAVKGRLATLPVIRNLLASWVAAPDWQMAAQCAQEQHRNKFGLAL